MIIYNTNNAAIIHIEVDDTSYSYREIMGDNKLYLEFALTQHVELPIGSYVDFQGSRFTLMSVSDVTIQHNRDYEYKVTFEGPEARFSKYRIHNPVDGRLVFEMTASPQEHLAMIVANLVEREGAGSWAAGVCIDGTEKTLAYNHTKLNDALTQLANAYDTEWEVVNGSINLNKVEYNSDSPLALGYGRNAGFKPGVGRTNYGETGQIERLFVQGGDRNISLREYGNSTLLLPKNFQFKFDGEKFKYTVDGTTYTETGFDASKAVDMVTDENGYSVALASAGAACNEESLDLTDIYPKRVGEVTGVRYLYDHQYLTWAEINALGLTEEQWLSVQVDIIDADIPATLDYDACALKNGEKLIVIFQTGMLAGREFNADFIKEARTQATANSQSEERPANRFELERATFNDIDMPNATFRPNASANGTRDTYIVVNCYLPEAYICDKATFSGAEMEMLRQSAKYLFANKDVQFTFKGEVDDLYTKRNWLNVGGKLKVGGCVSFTHAQVQAEPLVTRIVAIKQYVNNPYSPEVTLSNESVKGGLSSRLSQLGNGQAHILYQQYALERYARRSFRDAKETMEMLESAMLEGFTERISPIAVQTMQLLLGDESLQFRYVDSKTNPQHVSPGISFNAGTKKLICNAGIIQHMTLGIETLSNSHNVSEYKFWDIARFESPFLGDALSEKKYYLYAKCSKAAEGETGYQVAEYVLSETAIAIESVSGYYHLLVGILNSESDEDRSFVTLFGFTEILPGRITTDKIVSGAGTTFWDLVQNILQMGDKLRYDPVNGLVLRGPLVQTGSGELTLVGAWCGQYDAGRIYAIGDEVWYQAADGTVSTYRYVNSEPSKGHLPTDTNYWQFLAKGVKGEDGQPGTDGDDGRGISSTEIKYAVSSNGTTPPVGENLWQSEIPSISPGYFLWTRTKVTYTDNTTSVSYSVAHSGTNGTDGTNGANGSSTKFLFKSQESQPSTPTGTNPSPSGWSNDATPAKTTTSLGNRVNVGSWTSGRVAVALLFKRATINTSTGAEVAPTIDWSGSLTISMSTGRPTTTPSGWSQSIPSGSTTLYVTWVVVTGTGSTATVSASRWATPVAYESSGINVNASSALTSALIADSIDDSEYTLQQMFFSTSKENVHMELKIVVASESNYDWLYVGNIDENLEVDTDDMSVANYLTRYSGGVNGAPKVETLDVLVKRAGTHRIDLAFVKDGSNTYVDIAAFMVGNLFCEQNVWMTSCRVHDGVASDWTTPICINGTNGQNGSDGPACPYRGEYNPSEIYFGLSSRTDIVSYVVNGIKKYYRANPCVGGSFKGIAPTNAAYWMDFGAQFSNIATGFLFAEEAVIENGVIRVLRTSDTGARIIARGDSLTMLDADLNTKLIITGADLADTPDDATESFGSGYALQDSKTTRQVNSGIDINGSIVLATFDVDDDVNSVKMPNVSLSYLLKLGASNSGAMYWSGRIWLVVDGDIEAAEAETIDMEFDHANGGYQETGSGLLYGYTLRLPAGSHTLSLKWESIARGYNVGSDNQIDFEIQYGSGTINISYPAQVTAIGANGFRAMFAGNQKVEFIKTGNAVEFLLRHGDNAIKLNSTGMLFSFNGGSTWYTASRDSSGYLKLT